jgi:hypothetical protein
MSVQYKDNEYMEFVMVLVDDVINPLRKHKKLIGEVHKIPAGGKDVIVHVPEISPHGLILGI